MAFQKKMLFDKNHHDMKELVDVFQHFRSQCETRVKVRFLVIRQDPGELQRLLCHNLQIKCSIIDSYSPLLKVFDGVWTSDRRLQEKIFEQSYVQLPVAIVGEFRKLQYATEGRVRGEEEGHFTRQGILP